MIVLTEPGGGIDALERDRKMVVFADYDVDGAASAALLVRWFRSLGRELPIYVPDRMTEGYGPSPAAFRHINPDAKLTFQYTTSSTSLQKKLGVA